MELRKLKRTKRRHIPHKLLTQQPAATIATAELLTVSLKIEFVLVAARNRRYRLQL